MEDQPPLLEPNEELIVDDSDDEQDPGDDLENIALQRQRFQANRNFETFAGLIDAFLTSIRSYHSKRFKKIWDTVAAGLSDLPHENDQQVEYVFYQLLDLLETTGDPYGSFPEDNPPRGFILVVIEEAKEMLGLQHIITYKLKLLLLFLSDDVAEDCQEMLHEDGSLEDLRQMFGEEGVKGPTIGSIYDTNIEEDPIRSVHYDLALGRVFKEAGALEEASNALIRGLAVARAIVEAGGSPEWRGSAWREDLTLCGSDLLRTQAGITIMMGQPAVALEYLKKDRVLQLAWAAEDGNPSTEDAPYVEYLTVIHQEEGFHIDQLEQLLQVHKIPPRFLDGVSFFIRANAILLYEAGETERCIRLLDMSLIHFGATYEELGPENPFRVIVLEEKYQLLLQRYKFQASTMADKPVDLLQIHVDFIKTVEVEDYVPGPDFDLITRKMLLLVSKPNTDDNSLAFAKDQAEKLLGEYPEDKLIEFEASRVFTEVSFREARNGCAAVGDFFRNSFATYVKQVKAGVKECVDPRFPKMINLLLNKLREENTAGSLAKFECISRAKELVLAILDVNLQRQEPGEVGNGHGNEGDISSLLDMTWSKIPEILDIWLQSVEILLDNSKSAWQMITPAEVMRV